MENSDHTGVIAREPLVKGEMISLDSLINTSELQSFHPIMARILAKADWCYNGLGEMFPGYPYPANHQAFPWFKALPENHELRQVSMDMDPSEFNRFLAWATECVPLTPITRLWPKETANITDPGIDLFMEWVKGTGIFNRIDYAIIFPTQAGYVTPIHRHTLDTEFVWIRFNDHKKFFVQHPETDERKFASGLINVFNDTDWHGSVPSWNNTYSLRVNGEFSDVVVRHLQRINKSIAKANRHEGGDPIRKDLGITESGPGA